MLSDWGCESLKKQTRKPYRNQGPHSVLYSFSSLWWERLNAMRRQSLQSIWEFSLIWKCSEINSLHTSSLTASLDIFPALVCKKRTTICWGVSKKDCWVFLHVNTDILGMRGTCSICWKLAQQKTAFTFVCIRHQLLICRYFTLLGIK